MSMTNPPTPAGAPIGFFPYRLPTYNNIQPFTYRDGMTYLDKLEDLTDWLIRYLTPYIDETVTGYVEAFNKALGELSKAGVELTNYLDGEKEIFDQKIAEFQKLSMDANVAFTATVNAALANIGTKVDAAKVAQAAAEAARDLADKYAAQAGVKADNTLAAFILDPLSAVNAALARFILPVLGDFAASTSASIDVYTASTADGPYEYELITIKAKGRTVNNLVEKWYGGYEKNTWKPGQPFRPVQWSTPKDGADASGAYIFTNADAIEGGRVSGVQIKNGVVLDTWGSSRGDDHRGVECLAFMNDGSTRVYRAASGITPEQMVAEGVHTTYGFGPIVVENGSVRDILGEARWSEFSAEVSARNGIGRRANGDVLIALVKGKTGISGIRGNELGNILARHGAVAGVMLDGGGTAQGWSNNRQFHLSSDTVGTRAMGCGIAIHVAPRGVVTTSEVPKLEANFQTQSGNEILTATKRDGIVQLRGNVGNIDGKPLNSNTWYKIAQLSERFRPVLNHRTATYGSGTLSGEGGNPVLIAITNDGWIQMRFPAGDYTSPSDGWAQINTSYEAAY